MYIILEMKDDSGTVSYTGDTSIYLNIKNYKLDAESPAWVDPSTSIVFPGTVDYNTIDIIIANSVNNDVWGRATGVKIV